MLSNTKLWQRVQDFAIDHAGDELPFSMRLARESGWSAERTAGAIEEYRRFVYLMGISPSPLTPSTAVDQVWHLHLTYTRSYWGELCEGVLGRPLHHEPITGGAAIELLDERYAGTRELYETEFESAPPTEYWPDAAPSDARLRRVDRRHFWILSKDVAKRLGLFLVPVTIIAVILGSNHGQAGSSGGPGHGTLVGLIAGLLLITAPFWLMAAFDGADRRKDGTCSGGGCGGCGGGCCGGG